VKSEPAVPPVPAHPGTPSNIKVLPTETLESRHSSGSALAGLPNPQQTSDSPSAHNAPRKRVSVASSHSAENIGNNSGSANVGAKIRETQQPSSSRALANLLDAEQTSERPAIQSTPRKRESNAPINNSAVHRQSDEVAPFFQPWWNGEARGNQRPSNLKAQKQAGELAPFFKPWWYAQPSADRRIRNPG